MKDIDKFRGCLIGGAAGDALGYPVEFLSAANIFAKYGPKGITEYEKSGGKALISDDTQMTLFTANGLLFGKTRYMTRGIGAPYEMYIARCYHDWYLTQTKSYPLEAEATCSWLVNGPELFSRRAPGTTCLSAIESGCEGTIEKPINQSKGCGGIIRVAPIGLYFSASDYEQREIDLLGARVAALTHGHELGYMPAAMLVHIISFICKYPDKKLRGAVVDSLAMLDDLFPGAIHKNYLKKLIKKAVTLAGEKMDDVEAIGQLGEGWVGEETLAIAIYCALKYNDDFDRALIAAVNHSGDSDSTGAVTGNILGTYLGLSNIPHKYQIYLELWDLLLAIADDMYNDCQIREYDSFSDETWEHKYIYHDYKI
ncbi:MAG: ADP-ribosylglycohydrolase family protein [Erysipelotrichaceae bacterium]|nr:ADP-ribosylglycohydrolase family protein [Erysipelotrichaceae bacterium]MDD3810212.1 ADP-ribosylglycohydrolase family protein [Erysipelotrichaceae bacterium]